MFFRCISHVYLSFLYSILLRAKCFVIIWKDKNSLLVKILWKLIKCVMDIKSLFPHIFDKIAHIIKILMIKRMETNFVMLALFPPQSVLLLLMSQVFLMDETDGNCDLPLEGIFHRLSCT